MKPYVYATRCTQLPMRDVPALHAMIDAAHPVTFDTFADACDWHELARELGYAVGRGEPGLHMKDDWHVGYYRSRWRGRPCYFVRWSAIEHIFIPNEQEG